MAKGAAPKVDEKWQAECDLETMINYQKIMKDQKRYKAAMAMKKEKLAAAGSNVQSEKGSK